LSLHVKIVPPISAQTIRVARACVVVTASAAVIATPANIYFIRNPPLAQFRLAKTRPEEELAVLAWFSCSVPKPIVESVKSADNSCRGDVPLIHLRWRCSRCRSARIVCTNHARVLPWRTAAAPDHPPTIAT